MKTRPNSADQSEQSPRPFHPAKPLTRLDIALRASAAVAVALFGIALVLDADEARSLLELDRPVSAPVPVEAKNTAPPLPLDVAEADPIAAQDVWQLDNEAGDAAVVTADGSDLTEEEAAIVPVAGEPEFVSEATEATVEAADEAGRSHVWTPIAEVSGRARVSLEPPVAEPAADSGKARVSSPLPLDVVPAGRSRVVSGDSVAGRATVSRPLAEESSVPLQQHLRDLYTPVVTVKQRQSAESPVAADKSKRVPLNAHLRDLYSPMTTAQSLPEAKEAPLVQSTPAKVDDAKPQWELADQETEQPAVAAVAEASKTEPPAWETTGLGTDSADIAAGLVQPAVAQAEEPAVPPSPDADSLDFDGFKPIGSLTVDISTIKGDDPPDLQEPEDLAGPEFDEPPILLEPGWIDHRMCAPEFPFYHQPLYFEDPNAERCGKTLGILQPVASAAQFYLTIPALPYLIGAYPPNEEVVSLGDCDYGCKWKYSDAYLPRWSLRGAAYQAAAVTGAIYLIP